MKTNTQEQMKKLGKSFNEPKVDEKLYRLVQEVYYGRTEKALALIESDPDQINRQDPYSGLTPLNIAVFRQNEKVVQALIDHPVTNIHLKDNFGRTAYDMLDYNANQQVFLAVFNAFKPEDDEEWERIFQEDGYPTDYDEELAPEFRKERPKDDEPSGP